MQAVALEPPLAAGAFSEALLARGVIGSRAPVRQLASPSRRR